MIMSQSFHSGRYYLHKALHYREVKLNFQILNMKFASLILWWVNKKCHWSTQTKKKKKITSNGIFCTKVIKFSKGRR